LEEQEQMCAATARSLLATDSGTDVEALEDQFNAIMDPETNVRGLYNNLVEVLLDQPCHISVLLEGKGGSPSIIYCEELLLFRT